jgi:predicted exporter
MRGRAQILGLWVVALAVCAYVIAHARFSADLSAFLPAHPTAAQRLLIAQLREGPASRLTLIALSGADSAQRAAVSRALAERLRHTGEFALVSNGAGDEQTADAKFVFAHRYQLSDAVDAQRFSVEGLRTAIAESVTDFSSPLGLVDSDLLARDPTGESQRVLQALIPSVQPRIDHGVWSSSDGRRALLVAQTRALGSDLDAQARAIESIRQAFAATAGATGATGGAGAPSGLLLELSGPPVFAVEARSTIVREASRLAAVSAGLIALLLIAVYRSARMLVLGLLPVVTGALVGVTAVALGFGIVHGVTLGFGGTLIGEAMDYSIYLFIQAERGAGPAGARWIATRWPTVRLGMLTSVVGFACLLPSAFPGLSQLGLYSVAGLLAAAVVTRFVLPQLLTDWQIPGLVDTLGRGVARSARALSAVRYWVWLLPALALAVLITHHGRLWAHELTVLSPVPESAQRLDQSLRADLGAPDVRALIVIGGSTRDAVLEASERLDARLAPLVSSGVIAGYDSPGRYLPSEASQRARLAALPDAATLRGRLAQTLPGLGLKPHALEPFVADVAAARAAGVLRYSDLEGTSLAAGVDALTQQDAPGWTALIPLRAPLVADPGAAIDAEAVRRAVGDPGPAGTTAVVLDIKLESDKLYAGYLAGAIFWSLAGLLAIAVLLWVALRSTRLVLRVLVPLLIAVLTVAAGLAAFGRPLTLMHLIGMLLTVAVASNYALFFAREPLSTAESAAVRLQASLVVANLATVIGFGVLALSSVPILSALGTTVASGAVIAFLLCAILVPPREPVAR